jgi:hypothetical protein
MVRVDDEKMTLSWTIDAVIIGTFDCTRNSQAIDNIHPPITQHHLLFVCFYLSTALPAIVLASLRVTIMVGRLLTPAAMAR